MSYMELHGPYMSWRVDQIQLPWGSPLGCYTICLISLESVVE